MTKALAAIQAELHSLDPAPLVAALDDLPAGVERWLKALDDVAIEETPELRVAARWLREHQPTASRVAICHGDMWAGNLLYDDGGLTGVIDWSLATVADPALDVGFTAMALTIAPVDTGPTVQRIVARVSRGIARRYVKAYVAQTGADLSDQPYYEALRCALQLVDVISYRRALAAGRQRDAPPPTWERAGDRMIEYFEARTGVRLALPPKVLAK
jgi:aminoglycoside phosphotransferase (APT) family kinase protein